MAFMGDVMIGRLVNEVIDQEGYYYPWGNALPLLKMTDLNIINLETALTKSDKKVLKVFNFKADIDKIKTLLKARIDVVNLANNHTLDFSEEGLVETIEVLNKSEIKHVGAGINEEEARKEVIMVKNKMKIGVIGYTDNEPGWKATDKPGINYIEAEDIEKIRKDIKKLKRKVDVLIITIHWGPNMVERPPQKFINFAHRAIDFGADIIHGHSAHIFQGIEIYKKKVNNVRCRRFYRRLCG